MILFSFIYSHSYYHIPIIVLNIAISMIIYGDHTKMITPNQNTYLFIVDSSSKKIASGNELVFDELGYNKNLLKTLTIDQVINEADGYLVNVDKDIIPVLISKTEYQGKTFISAYDLTFHQLYQNELMSAKEKIEEANSVKGEFYSNMTHEIRTPLNAIIGFSEVLKDKISKDHHYYIENIVKSGNYLLKMINNMLDIAIIDSNRLVLKDEPVSICRVFKDIFKEYESEINRKGIEVKVDHNLNENHYPLFDKVRLVQVIKNIVDNAVKFTDSGHIYVNVGVTIRDESTMDIYFKISDTGIGMDKEDIENIFSSFIRNKKHRKSIAGKGLDLSLVKRLVDKMGGEIKLESELGRGTSFNVSFNSIKFIEQDSTDETGVEDRESNISNLKILVAEDLPVNRLLISEMLSEISPQIIEAEDGNSAVNLALENDIDLILMDLSMPYLDGVGASKLIKDKKNIPIICLTATKNLTKEQIALFDGVVTKPVSKNNLMKYIKSLIKPENKFQSYQPKSDGFNISKYTLNSDIDSFKKELEFITTTLNLKKCGEFIDKMKLNIEPLDDDIKLFIHNLSDSLKKLNFTQLIKGLNQLKELN